MKRLKINAVPEPSKYLLENNEEKENVQKRQLVIKKADDERRRRAKRRQMTSIPSLSLPTTASERDVVYWYRRSLFLVSKMTLCKK